MSPAAGATPAQASAFLHAGSYRPFGQIAVARLGKPVGDVIDPAPGRLDSLVLCLVPRPFEWRGAARAMTCPAGGGILLDRAFGGAMPDDGLAVVVPRRLLPALFDDRAAARIVPPSAAVAAVRRLAARLLAPEVRLNPAQAKLAGRAMGELTAAALLPLATPQTHVAPRRTASLLDGLFAYVAAHLAEPLDAAALCTALACSRSALYRAAVPVGGVAALVAEQRLAAVHRRLSEPDERRTVATLARAHGFADPAVFSRSFKRRYGVTPRAVRGPRDPVRDAR